MSDVIVLASFQGKYESLPVRKDAHGRYYVQYRGVRRLIADFSAKERELNKKALSTLPGGQLARPFQRPWSIPSETYPIGAYPSGFPVPPASLQPYVRGPVTPTASGTTASQRLAQLERNPAQPFYEFKHQRLLIEAEDERRRNEKAAEIEAELQLELQRQRQQANAKRVAEEKARQQKEAQLRQRLAEEEKARQQKEAD